MKWVLLVDDEPHVTRLVRTRLERRGFGVEVAHDGRDALEKLAHRAFDAMVTDLSMPRMDGVELCEAVRKNSRNENTFIFVATSRAQSEFRDWAASIARLEFLEKPISLVDLERRLQQVLEGGADPEPGS